MILILSILSARFKPNFKCFHNIKNIVPHFPIYTVKRSLPFFPIIFFHKKKYKILKFTFLFMCNVFIDKLCFYIFLYLYIFIFLYSCISIINNTFSPSEKVLFIFYNLFFTFIILIFFFVILISMFFMFFRVPNFFSIWFPVFSIIFTFIT